MKTLILAAAVALTASAANAVDMPEQIRLTPEWCQTKTAIKFDKAPTPRDWSMVGLVGTDKACTQITLSVMDGRFDLNEDLHCTAIRVGPMQLKPPRDRTIEWSVTARCIDHEARNPKVKEFRFSLYEGTYLTLYMRRGR